MVTETLLEISRELARVALEIGAIQFNPEDPFTWASGYRMPVYNDNRLLLGQGDHRTLVGRGFQEIIRRENLAVDVVAGTATAGIPHATTLANLLGLPLIYVRSKPKEHGMKNQVEGSIQKHQKAIVVEDLISTGGSALDVIQTIRKAGAFADNCLSIFTYSFRSSTRGFAEAQCRLHSLLDFPTLLQFVEESQSFNLVQTELLRDWYRDPFTWGKRHGFMKK